LRVGAAGRFAGDRSLRLAWRPRVRRRTVSVRDLKAWAPSSTPPTPPSGPRARASVPIQCRSRSSANAPSPSR